MKIEEDKIFKILHAIALNYGLQSDLIKNKSANAVKQEKQRESSIHLSHHLNLLNGVTEIAKLMETKIEMGPGYKTPLIEAIKRSVTQSYTLGVYMVGEDDFYEVVSKIQTKQIKDKLVTKMFFEPEVSNFNDIYRTREFNMPPPKIDSFGDEKWTTEYSVHEVIKMSHNPSCKITDKEEVIKNVVGFIGMLLKTYDGNEITKNDLTAFGKKQIIHVCSFVFLQLSSLLFHVILFDEWEECLKLSIKNLEENNSFEALRRKRTTSSFNIFDMENENFYMNYDLKETDDSLPLEVKNRLFNKDSTLVKRSFAIGKSSEDIFYIGSLAFEPGEIVFNLGKDTWFYLTGDANKVTLVSKLGECVVDNGISCQYLKGILLNYRSKNEKGRNE